MKKLEDIQRELKFTKIHFSFKRKIFLNLKKKDKEMYDEIIYLYKYAMYLETILLEDKMLLPQDIRSSISG